MMRGLKKYRTLARTTELWAYAFLSIPIIFYVVVRFYPTLYAFYLSLTDWDIVSSNMNFIGFENYSHLWDDAVFKKTLFNTIRYVVCGLPVSLFLGFVLAYHINYLTVGSDFFKTVYFMPYITSMVAVAWVWRWLFQPPPVGVFNNILATLGFSAQPFLRSTTQAPFAILMTTIWADLGFQMIIFLAGMKGISEQYYEAARIDGATNMQQLRAITLPLLKPTMVFLVITGTIRYLRIFTQVMNMTSQGDGGPLNSTKPLVLYIYDTAFRSFEMGYSATMTVVLFCIILVVTLIQMRISRSEET